MGRSFEPWTAERIDVECARAYDAYAKEIRARHVEYFAGRPAERSSTRPFMARARSFAFPPGWGWLAGAVGERAWHRHHLSAASSQTLAIALLSAATRSHPTLDWLPAAPCGGRPLPLFEVELAPSVLHEQPRQTSLDWLVLGTDGVVAAEAKFTERGFGRCSCEARTDGRCSPRVLERPYWDVAGRELGLRRDSSGDCSLSPVYQVVRNVAAAQAIGSGRATTFLVLYDARNPYFSGAREWPGWVKMLTVLMANSTTALARLSWQELLSRTDLDREVTRWAAEKHGLS